MGSFPETYKDPESLCRRLKLVAIIVVHFVKGKKEKENRKIPTKKAEFSVYLGKPLLLIGAHLFNLFNQNCRKFRLGLTAKCFSRKNIPSETDHFDRLPFVWKFR